MVPYVRILTQLQTVTRVSSLLSQVFAYIFRARSRIRMKNIFTFDMVAIAVLLLLITGIGATNFITPAYAQKPETGFKPDRYSPGKPTLSGVWKSNDGGTYYLSQIGNILWWTGMSGGNDGRTYSNVFKGTLDLSKGTIAGEWSDVPRGTNRNAGTMTLQMANYDTLVKISQTGGFGPTLWEKVSGPILWRGS